MPTVSPQEHPTAHYAKATLGVALMAGLIYAAYVARSVLILVLISMVLSVGMDPGVRYLERRFKLSRSQATAVILFGLLGFLVLFLALVIPPIAHEVQEFARRVPAYIEQLQASGGLLGELETRFNIGEQLEKLADNAPDIAQSSLATVMGVTGAIASGLFNGVTILVLVVYFTSSLPSIENGIASLIAPDKRDDFRGLMDKATEKIGGYAAGQATVSLIAGVVSFFAFLVIGLPFPAALAMWVAFTALIPQVGALLGAALCVLVASFVGISTAIITAVFIFVYQQIENYLISPRIMKKAVDLSPAAVILSILIGGSILGFVGALLALPITAAGKVVIRDMLMRNRVEPAPTKSAPGRRKPPAASAKATPAGKAPSGAGSKATTGRAKTAPRARRPAKPAPPKDSA